MIAYTKPKAILAGFLSTIFAALVMTVRRVLLVSLRFSFTDDPGFNLADCDLPPSWQSCWCVPDEIYKAYQRFFRQSLICFLRRKPSSLFKAADTEVRVVIDQVDLSPPTWFSYDCLCCSVSCLEYANMSSLLEADTEGEEKVLLRGFGTLSCRLPTIDTSKIDCHVVWRF